MRLRRDGVKTRERILLAAAKIFESKGFREAIHVEICREAKTNVAAVNYHFGSKENLYVEAWREAFRRSSEAYPLEGKTDLKAPPEERLKGQIQSFMCRIADPTCYDFAIVHKKLANPTGFFAEAISEAFEPFRLGLSNTIRELLGESSSERQVLLCLRSICAQCFEQIPRLRQCVITENTPPRVDQNLPKVAVDEMADHVTRFSLGGD